MEVWKTDRQQPGEEIAVHPLDRYDLAAYMLAYWEGRIVYQEAVLPLRNADGAVADIPLMYPAREILCVRSSDLRTVYQAGRDYTLCDGRLHIPQGSSIAAMAYDLYWPTRENSTCKRLNEAYGSGYIFFSEGALMHTLQLAVTYIHDGTFTGQVPACKAGLLPQTAQKLKNGEALKLCVLGDSICVGGNSTGWLSVEPMAKTWYEMFADQLARTYPRSAVFMENPSVGGKQSAWGAEVAAEKAGYGPDLCMIGFGMNDGTKRVPPETYGQNIKTIISAVRAGNPACEFVLISTMLPNPMVSHFLGCQEAYLPVLLQMERQGVAVADVTTLHKHLLTRKRFCDMSGNNVNHPNDFMARAYAHVLWQTVIGY